MLAKDDVRALWTPAWASSDDRLRQAKQQSSLAPEREHSGQRSRFWRPDRSELKARRCRHHRCSAGVHRGDDPLDVDALQVDARGAEVGMAVLSLSDAFTTNVRVVGIVWAIGFAGGCAITIRAIARRRSLQQAVRAEASVCSDGRPRHDQPRWP